MEKYYNNYWNSILTGSFEFIAGYYCRKLCYILNLKKVRSVFKCRVGEVDGPNATWNKLEQVITNVQKAELGLDPRPVN